VANGYIPHTEDLQNAFNSYSLKSLFESSITYGLKVLASSLASMVDPALASTSTTTKRVTLAYVLLKASKDLTKGVLADVLLLAYPSTTTFSNPLTPNMHQRESPFLHVLTI
jgi:hypothetical protein